MNESEDEVIPDPKSSGITKEPLAYRAVRGGLWVAASSYFNVAFGFLANLVLTRILAPEDFGVFAMAGFFFALVNLRPKMGIGQAFAQRKETTGELVGTHLTLDVASGTVTVLLAGAAVAVLRAFGYSWDVVLVVLALAGVGIVDSVMGTAWILLDKELHFGRTSTVSSIVFPLSYLPAFWLALNGGAYWSLVAQNGTYALLLLVGMWWAARHHLPHIWQLRWGFDRRVAVDLVRFGGMVGLASIAGMLVVQFDDFLVGTFVGLATLGFYDRAYRIAQWPQLLVASVVSRAAFYTYARLQGDAARLEKTVAMTTWLNTTVALPLALAIFASAPDLVSLLYGDRWLASALLLRFLVVYSAARPIMDNFGSLFTALGRPRLTAVTVGLEAAILIVSGFPLTLLWGAVGTCAAVGLAFGVGLIVRLAYIRRLVQLPLWDAIMAPTVAACLTLIGYTLLEQSVGFGDWPLVTRVVVKGVYAVGAFAALILLMQPEGTAERVRYTWRLALSRSDK